MKNNVKVGIVTQYYNSLNFGGVLQAYALCEVLSREGYNAEQISVSWTHKGTQRKIAWYEYFNLVKILKKLCRCIWWKRHKYRYQKLKPIVVARREAFKSFNCLVPHSPVYDSNELKNIVEKYDAFITGSDQVWSCGEMDSPYFLTFVPEEKKKISYAASLGKIELDSRLRDCLTSELDKFNGISVREKDAVTLVQSCTKNEVTYCLDPTLLLTREDWEQLVSDRKIQDAYLLCYFLGDDIMHRRIAKEYARRHHLKIVTFPHYPDCYHKSDKHFGDIELIDANPQDFLALIKNATTVFTDSFHASIFSWHFQKDFFTFGRKKERGMEGRLYSLMDLLDIKGRFIDDVKRDTLWAIENAPKIDYTKKFSKYEQMREQSMQYLRKYLGE